MNSYVGSDKCLMNRHLSQWVMTEWYDVWVLMDVWWIGGSTSAINWWVCMWALMDGWWIGGSTSAINWWVCMCALMNIWWIGGLTLMINWWIRIWVLMNIWWVDTSSVINRLLIISWWLVALRFNLVHRSHCFSVEHYILPAQGSMCTVVFLYSGHPQYSWENLLVTGLLG